MNTEFERIKPGAITDNPFKAIGNDWFLITSGNIDNHKTYNTMTAGWGGLGILWNKPVAYIFIRPSRHTYQFSEKHDLFTLSFFDKAYREALNLCGTVSGRDQDKVSEAGLTPVTFEDNDEIVAFKEARLVMVCKKVYYQDLQPEQFLAPYIEKNYPQKDYHRMYVGEITGVYGKK